MTTINPGSRPNAADLEAARLPLERLGVSPADLLASPSERPPVPTLAEYIPIVAIAVSVGTRRVYGSYWTRILEQWGGRRLDEPTPSEIRQLMGYVKAHVVARRNARGGRSAAEHLVAALRCIYRHAADDGLISKADNPACRTTSRPATAARSRHQHTARQPTTAPTF